MGQQLIYGQWSTGLVFMKPEQVEERTCLFRAVGTARTWGDFRLAVAWERYEEIIEGMRYRAESDRDGWTAFDEFLQTSDQLRPTAAEQQAARAAYERIDVQGRGPLDTDPFNAYMIPGYEESEWPEWPAQGMLRWIPQAVQQCLGVGGCSRISGDYLALPTEHEAEIVAAMTAAGYDCRRDDPSIEAAHGA